MKALLIGAGLSLIAGVALGGALRPQLYIDRPEGPQMFAAWSADQSTGPFDDGAAVYASYDKAPDYVLGSDFRTLAARPQVAAVAEQTRYEAALAHADAAIASAQEALDQVHGAPEPPTALEAPAAPQAPTAPEPPVALQG